MLEVKVGKYLDTSLIKADIQPEWVRLLIKGYLLQLELGAEASPAPPAFLPSSEIRRRWSLTEPAPLLQVFPDRSVATRSKATGALLITMPKVDPKQATIYGTGRGATEPAKVRQEALPCSTPVCR